MIYILKSPFVCVKASALTLIWFRACLSKLNGRLNLSIVGLSRRQSAIREADEGEGQAEDGPKVEEEEEGTRVVSWLERQEKGPYVCRNESKVQLFRPAIIAPEPLWACL
jgi:hypothetical protein